jgi:anti-sigma B factor antagonist
MPDTRRPALHVEEHGSDTVATPLAPRILDEEQIQAFGDDLVALVEQRRPTRMVLDFRNVEALSSEALARLFSLKKKLAAAGGSLKLCGIRPELLEVFRITRLDTVLEILPDLPAALARP